MKNMTNIIKSEIINNLIYIAKQMEELKLVNTFEGNLSVQDNGLLYITPARTRKSTLKPEMIAVFDMDDNQIHGTKRASSEKSMHQVAYTIRDDIKAVIHCHSPYLTAHAICHVPLDYSCHPEILFHFKDIPVAPYGQPGTTAIIDMAKPFLKNRNLVLLANHGVIAVGSSLEKAFQRIEAAEKFAQIASICRTLGPMQDIPQSEIDRILAREIET